MCKYFVNVDGLIEQGKKDNEQAQPARVGYVKTELMRSSGNQLICFDESGKDDKLYLTGQI